MIFLIVIVKKLIRNISFETTINDIITFNREYTKWLIPVVKYDKKVSYRVSLVLPQFMDKNNHKIRSKKIYLKSEKDATQTHVPI